jgi:hypothetical protein
MGSVTLGLKSAIYRCPPDFEGFGNLRSTQTLFLQLADLRYINGWRTPLIDTGGFGFGNTFGLPLSTQVRFEFCEHPEHVEKCFLGCAGRIYGLFCSVALRLEPLAFTARTISCKSPILSLVAEKGFGLDLKQRARNLPSHRKGFGF